MTTVTYPWEDAELLDAEEAAERLTEDVEYDSWLDEYLGELFGEEELPAYVPFQDVPESWGCETDDQIGYMESVAPYLF